MNDYPHRIRLRGPWDYEPLAHTLLHLDGRMEVLDRPLPPPGRMTMPCHWNDGGLPAFEGRVRFRRRFQKPRQLDVNERLWLVFEAADYFATVWLNGEELGRHEGAFDPFAFEVTRLIEQRNELVVEVDCPAEVKKGQRMFRGVLPPGGGLWGDVAVEIRREANLRELLFRTTFTDGMPTLICEGVLVDERERLLELYILLDGHTIAYEKLTGTVAGRPFQFATPLPDIERWQPRGCGSQRLYEVRAELIDVSTKLDVRVRSVGIRDLGGDENRGLVTVNGHEVAIAGSLDLDEPLVAATAIDAADQSGCLYVLRLPIPKQLRPGDSRVAAEAQRQARVIVRETMHHPSLVGCRCGEWADGGTDV